MKTRILGACLILLHCCVLFAGFFAPYDPTAQNREIPFAPPTQLHFWDAQGHFHWRPFIYQSTAKSDCINEYEELKTVRYPVRFLHRAGPYTVAGFSMDIHLFGTDAPAQLLIAGTDGFGRDQFSRILYGGRISIAAGLLATILSLVFATIIGTLSGFYGRWIDELVMRFAELFIVLPWLYLLLTIRTFLPLYINPEQTFLLLVAMIGTIGWARPARLVRGVVLSAKSRKYVLASRGFGASDFHLIRRHIFPDTYGVLLTQLALLIPQYVVAEVALSFFGLGLSEPSPSWGNLLATVQQYNVLVSYWWMLSPALALVVFCFGYLLVANALQEKLQSISS